MGFSNIIVRLVARFFTFDELKRAYHKLDNADMPLPSRASQLAYAGLRVASMVGAIGPLRKQYAEAKSLAPAQAPSNNVYDKHYLNLRLNRIHDPIEVVVDATRPRSVNVLVPAFEFRSMSAGFFGVFQTALFFARLGHHVRLVMFDKFHFDAVEFRQRMRGYPGLEQLFDLCEAEYVGDRVLPLSVNPGDICVATVWYSAFLAERIHKLLDRPDFIYLIQDYETAFYPGGSWYTQADLSYEMQYTPLFSSKSLRDQFYAADIGGLRRREQRAIYFHNACSANLPPREQFLASKLVPRKKRLAFYSRPIVDRNMFELSALVLCEAYERGILNADDWECYGMGLGEGVVQLADGLTSTSLPRMNLKEYLDVVPSFDICLTLMASPHPSMIPMDLGCSGAVVVTNTFQTKTPEYLSSLCDNIISAPPALEALLAALKEAVGRADEYEARYDAAATSTYPRTWDETFTAEHVAFFDDLIGRPRSAA